MEMSRSAHYAPPQARLDDPDHVRCPRCEALAFSPDVRKPTPLRPRACQSCGALLAVSWRGLLVTALPLVVLQLLWSLEIQLWLWFQDHMLFGFPAFVWLSGVPIVLGLYVQKLLLRHLPLVERTRKQTGEWPPF